MSSIADLTKATRPKRPSYTQQYINDVLASDLPRNLRCLLLVLAHLANHENGQAWYGQEEIAKQNNVSERQVRREMAEAEALGWLRRTPRFHKGKRISDLWKLTSNRTPMAACATPSNRPSMTEQPDTHDQTNRTPMAGDPPSDPSRDPKEKQTPPSAVPILAKAEEPATGHDVLHSFYVSEFKRLRNGAAPIISSREHKAFKDLIGKLPTLSEAKRRITNGLTSWGSETIIGIASNPDKYINGSSTSTPATYTGPSRAEVIASGRIEHEAKIDAMSDDVRAEFEEMVESGNYTVETAISYLRFKHKPHGARLTALTKGVA